MIAGIQNKNLVNFYKENVPTFQKDQRELSVALGENDVKYGPWTLSFEMAPAVLDKSDLKLIKSAVEKTIRGAELLTLSGVKPIGGHQSRHSVATSMVTSIA